MHTSRDNMESLPPMKTRKKYSHIIQLQTLIYWALLCVHVKLFLPALAIAALQTVLANKACWLLSLCCTGIFMAACSYAV